MNVQKVLNNTVKYFSDKGYSFNRDLIYSVFLSLKTQSFVILTGDTGSGKKTFARLFSNSIGANKENGRFKIISAEADWNTSKHLLGSSNENSDFYPGLILPFLKEAMENRDKPYFLCIDNFNIARPEQYLSSILSTFSQRQRDDDGHFVTPPVLQKEIFANDYTSFEKWGDIRIYDNLYIFAIAKRNEAYYPITDEIIDRAFCIELSNKSLVYTEPDCDRETIEPIDINNDILKPEFVSSLDFSHDFGYFKDISITLDLLNKTVLHSSFPISIRTRDAFLIYSHYCTEYDVFLQEKCFDFLMTNKILPAIHGATSDVQRCLSDLFVYCLVYGDEDIEQYPTSSVKMEQIKTSYKLKYPCTANKVMDMFRRYEDDGYTSFWK